MATYYWVGGSGTWNTSTTTNWATSSGGAGGNGPPISTDVVIFNSSSGGGTCTLGANVSCLTLTLTGYTGTMAFGTNTITLTGSNANIFFGDTTYSISGTPLIICNYSGSTGSRGLISGSVTEANSISFNITAGTDSITCSNANVFRDLNFTGFTGTIVSVNRTIYGSLTLNSGITISGAQTLTFAATSGTKTITTNGVTVDMIVTFNGAGGTWQLQDNLTMGSTRVCTLTNGTLDLKNNTLTAVSFSSNNSNTRAVLFGTGNITLVGNNTTLWNLLTVTNWSVTGTPVVNSTYSGSTGTRTFQHRDSSEARAITFNITAGSDTVSFGGSGANDFAKNLNFTGFSGTVSNAAKGVYGNLTYPAAATVSAGTQTTSFLATSGTQVFITNNVSLDIPFTFGAAGSTTTTFTLSGNLVTGSTRTVTHTAGTIDLGTNNATLSCGIYSSSNSNIRGFNFGTSGNLTVTSNNTTIFNTSTNTNLTISGTAIVNATYSGSTGTRIIAPGVLTETNCFSFNVSAGSDSLNISGTTKNLNFTGFTGTLTNQTITIYGNLTLVAGMTLTAGANITTFASTSTGNTITSAGKTQDYPITFNGVGGVWTCQDALTLGSTRALTMTNGTLNLKSGATSTVGSFVTSGTNQKYLGASTLGSQATISDASGTNTVNYLTIKDSLATGGATWNSLWTNNNVDDGNNSGWFFGDAPLTLATENVYNLRSFTQPRRF